jgi:hypothetical protein
MGLCVIKIRRARPLSEGLSRRALLRSRYRREQNSGEWKSHTRLGPAREGCFPLLTRGMCQTPLEYGGGGGIYSVKSSYRGRINVMRIKGCRWESNPSIKHMSNSDECEKS